MTEQDKLIQYIQKHLSSIEGCGGGNYPTWDGEEDWCEIRMAKDILKFINK